MTKQKTDFQIILSGQDRLTAPIAKAANKLKALTAPLDRFSRKTKAVGTIMGFTQLGRSVKKVYRDISSVNSALGMTTTRLRNMALLGTAVAGSILLVSKNIADVGLEFQRAEIKFKATMGEEGLGLLDQLREMGEKLPFTTNQFITMADTIRGLNASMKAPEVLKYTSALGDIAALTGADIGQLSLSVAQSVARGKIETRDIKELASRGVPIRDAMIDQLNKIVPKKRIQMFFGKDKITGIEFDKLMQKGMISSKLYEKAFFAMTEKGSKFYEGMRQFMGTLPGLIIQTDGAFENLKRKIFGTSEEIGPLGTITKAVFERLLKLVTRASKYIDRNREGLNKWAKGLADSLPTVDQMVESIKRFKDSAVEFWDTLKPIRNLVSKLVDKFGAWEVILGSLALFIASPMILALTSLTGSLIGVLGALGKVVAMMVGSFFAALGQLATVLLPSTTAALIKLKIAAWAAIAPFLVMAAKVAVIAAGVLALSYLLMRAFHWVVKNADMLQGKLQGFADWIGGLSETTNHWFDWFLKPIQFAIEKVGELLGLVGKIDVRPIEVLDNKIRSSVGLEEEKPVQIGADDALITAGIKGFTERAIRIIVDSALGTSATVVDAPKDVEVETGPMVGGAY